MKSTHIITVHAAGVFILAGIILIFAFHASAQVCTPAPVGLAAWYRAENNLLDARGGNNGTSPANPMTYAQGMVGQAFSIPGLSASNRWDVPDNPSLNQQTLTIEAWIRTPGNGGNAGFIASKSGLDGGSGFEFFFGYPGEGNHLRFDLNGGSGGADLTGNINITDNVFHHVAATYDGATMKLYVDGVLDVQKAVATTISYAAGRPFTIDGREYPDVFPANMPGIIDELAFYDRALSLTEIQAIHDAGTAGKCNPTATVTPSGLVGFWAGDGDANDISGNGNNGTTANGAGFALGKVGQGFSFDGIDDFVNITNNGDLDFGTGDFSIEFWANLDSLANDQTLFHKVSGSGSSPNDPSYFVEFDVPNALRFRTGEGLSNVNDLIVNTSLSAGQWFQVTAVRNGDENRLYLDGILIGSQTAGSNANTGTGGNTSIGRCISGGGCVRFVDGKIDEVSVYNRALSLSEIQSIYNAGLAGKLKIASTPAGFAQLAQRKSDSSPNRAESVNTAIGDATVTFQSVTTAGQTQQIPLDLSQLPPLPIGVTSTGLTYDIATSAAYSGVGVCFNLPSFTPAQFANLRIYHLESGNWVNRTAASNSFPMLCTTGVTSLSPFAIGSVAPTAANVSVAGRVFDAFGNGIPGVRVSITDLAGTVRTALTSPFGFYRFEDIPAGETCIVSVASKRYTFSQPVRVVTANDSLGNVDFTADQ